MCLSGWRPAWRLWIFFKDTAKDRTLKFDWFGFGTLSVGLAALQLLLDRGTTKDWFSSPEIVIEAITARHRALSFPGPYADRRKNPSSRRRSSRTAISSGGLVLMFVMGLVLLASSALISPYLQNLSGRSVTQTGFLMVPRGLGVMFAMMFAGRLTMKMDPRLIMTVGASLLLWSLWAMTDWTPDVSETTVAWVTFVQGLGMGLVFVPMNMVAFATLTPQLRTDGAGLTNLMRNIGSAIGVSLTATILANSVQTIHAQLAGQASTFNRALGVNGPSMYYESTNSFWVGKSEFSHRIPRASSGLCQRLPFHVPYFPACLCDYLADEASVFRGRTNP